MPYNGEHDAQVTPDAGDAAVPVCGNGSLDQGEDCDVEEFGGQSCATLGYDNGELSCTSGCQINTSGCSECGDQVQQGDEHCDGDDLGGGSCEGLGFDGGSLSCGVDCLYDTGLCTGSGCGDSVIDTGEDCDSGNLDGQTCITMGMGFTDGVLTCDLACHFDTSGCSTCGDDIQTGVEDCDGTDFDGVTCMNLGHTGGNLGCTTGCFYDETDCADCGNGVIESGESCDSSELGSADCVSLGFSGGTLGCGITCNFNTTACTVCGDGQLDAGEECDEGGNNSDTAPDACRTSCLNFYCGDGVCDTGETAGNCAPDCKVLVFSDGFESGWPGAWTTGDNYPELWEDDVDTWEPATNGAHTGSRSMWCAGNGNNNSTYDNNMGAWAIYPLDLSTAAGRTVHYDMWLDVHVQESDDYFSASFSVDNGNNWTGLDTFNGDTNGWVFRSWDISAAAGISTVYIGLYFYSDGLYSNAHGAYVDDIEVWYEL